MRLSTCLAAATAWVVLSANAALAYGLFACYDPAGRRVCLVDTGTRTNFSPTEACTMTYPACQGRCTPVRYYPQRSGHWEETKQFTPGITGNNRIVPGPDTARDARTILREGLVEPQTPPPPARTPAAP
jgi:hypothetical protein